MKNGFVDNKKLSRVVSFFACDVPWRVRGVAAFFSKETVFLRCKIVVVVLKDCGDPHKTFPYFFHLFFSTRATTMTGVLGE